MTMQTDGREPGGDGAHLHEHQKREATLRAHGALHGIAVMPSTNDREQRVYIVNHHGWAFTKELPDLDAVENWLRVVTGKKL